MLNFKLELFLFYSRLCQHFPLKKFKVSTFNSTIVLRQVWQPLTFDLLPLKSQS